jgi:hypothetical protein
VKHLWLTAGAMTFGGAILALAGLLTALSPVAFVAGVLLFWSGLIKIVVLRIWRSTLASPPVPPDQRGRRPSHPPASGAAP